MEKKSIKKPNIDQPWSKFYIGKMLDGLEVTVTPIESGSNAIFLTFFELILKVLESIPDGAFIVQDKGFFESSIFYSYESDTALLNLLRHMGLSKKEIQLSINTIKDQYKRR